MTVHLAENKRSGIALARTQAPVFELSWSVSSRPTYVCGEADRVDMMRAGFHVAGCRPGSASGLAGDHRATG